MAETEPFFEIATSSGNYVRDQLDEKDVLEGDPLAILWPNGTTTERPAIIKEFVTHETQNGQTTVVQHRQLLIEVQYRNALLPVRLTTIRGIRARSMRGHQDEVLRTIRR